MRDYTNEPATPTAKLKVLGRQERKQKEFRSRDITRRNIIFPSPSTCRPPTLHAIFRGNRGDCARSQYPLIHTPTTSSLEVHTSHGWFCRICFLPSAGSARRAPSRERFYTSSRILSSPRTLRSHSAPAQLSALIERWPGNAAFAEPRVEKSDSNEEEPTRRGPMSLRRFACSLLCYSLEQGLLLRGCIRYVLWMIRGEFVKRVLVHECVVIRVLLMVYLLPCEF